MATPRLRAWCAAAFAALLAAPLAAGDFGLAPPLVLPVGHGVFKVALQDVTGDGLPDIVAGLHTPDGVVTLVNLGGSFGPPVPTDIPGSMNSWDFGDFDADGLADLVLCTYDDPWRAEVLLSDGAGGFSLAGEIPLTGFVNLPTLATADFNEDGFADIVAGHHQVVRLFFGDGTGTFTEQPPIASLPWVWSVHAIRSNGDSHWDVLVCYGGFGVGWQVHLGDGTGSFVPAAGLVWGSCDAEFGGHGLGDLNADQLPDLVVSFIDYCGPFGASSLQAGLSNGSTIEGDYPADVTDLLSSFGFVAVADLDGDTRGDVVGTYGSTTSLQVLLGLGDGSFQPEFSVPAGKLSSDVATGDLDGDTVPDIVAVNPGAGSVSVLLNTSAPPGWSDAGPGLAGSAGVPELQGSGPLVAGGAMLLTLAHGMPGGLAALVVGLENVSVPFKGGVLVPSVDVVLGGLGLSPGGALQLAGSWPAGIAPGVTTWWQAWIADSAGPKGYAASNALAAKAQAP